MTPLKAFSHCTTACLCNACNQPDHQALLVCQQRLCWCYLGFINVNCHTKLLESHVTGSHSLRHSVTALKGLNVTLDHLQSHATLSQSDYNCHSHTSLFEKKTKQHECCAVQGGVLPCRLLLLPPPALSQPRQGFGSYLAAPPLTAWLFQEYLLPDLSIVLCFLALLVVRIHSTQVPPCTTTRVQHCNFICHQSLIQQLPSHFHTSPPAPQMAVSGRII